MGLASILLLSMLASEQRVDSFGAFSPLTLEQLYEKRMRFERGEPRISVGIMRGQTSVAVASDAPLRVMFDEDQIPKVAYAPPKTRWTFRLSNSRPAELRYWVVVHTHRAVDAGFPGKALAAAKRTGVKARAFEVGTIISVRGTVLDTREWLVGVGGFSSQDEAESLLAKLLKARGDDAQLFLHEELVKRPSGTIGVYDGAGKLVHLARDVVSISTTPGGLLRIEDVEFGRGYRWHGREGRAYRDQVYVAVDGDGQLAVVNSIGAEKLLAGLVPAEIFATAHLEALKAQAVTARGEIFSKIAHRHFADPFHLCSDQHCQVYAGAKSEHPATNQAVAQTRGLLAVRPRKEDKDPLVLVDSRYSSSCGGYSEGNETVWGTAPSRSLRSRLDGSATDPALAPFSSGLDDANLRAFVESYPPVACARASVTRASKFRWVRTFTATQADSLVADLGVGKLHDVEILGRGHGGRVTGVHLVGTRGSADVMRELGVRRRFANLNSGMFIVDIQRNAQGTLQSLTFTGGGWGHGVGMCQMGAIARAEQGQTFREILGHYYNGAVVEQIYGLGR